MYEWMYGVYWCRMTLVNNEYERISLRIFRNFCVSQVPDVTNTPSRSLALRREFGSWSSKGEVMLTVAFSKMAWEIPSWCRYAQCCRNAAVCAACVISRSKLSCQVV